MNNESSKTGSQDGQSASLGEQEIASGCRLGGGPGRWWKRIVGGGEAQSMCSNLCSDSGLGSRRWRGSAEIRPVGSLKRGRLRKGEGKS